MSDHFWPDHRMRVRKRQQCEACKSFIQPGEVAVYQKGVYYGEFFGRHLHPVCRDIWFTSLDDTELGDYEETLLNWLQVQLGDVEGRECYDASRESRKGV